MYLQITAAFLTQSVVLDNATVKFEIWDTAGQGIKDCRFAHILYS